MRSFLKIFLTVVVLSSGFVGYVLWQPAAAKRTEATRPPEVQPRHQSHGDAIVGGGEQGWVRQFDNAGNLSSRFRLHEWEPPENGLIHVTRPEAEFYFKGKGDARAKVTVQGADGEVTAETLPGAGQADSPLDPKSVGTGAIASGPTQPPSSGRLNNVVIQVFETDTATVPMLTLKTNNIVFDNEAFRISTETYTDINGTVIPADQVAVMIEGRDFDFFGRGLTVRWNDVDQRLDLLRIAHGDKLVVKNPGTFSKSLFGGEDKREKAAPVAEMFRPRWEPLRAMLASADPAAAGAAIDAAANQPAGQRKKKRRDKDAAGPAHTQPAAHKPQPPYRATFNDQVRILEGEQRVGVADLMNVDFLLASQDDDKPQTQPATRPTPAATPTTSPTTGPTSRPTTTASASPTSRPTTGPATSPAVQPITVYWTGDMTVTPSTLTALPKPLAPGDAEVELVAAAAPVELTRENSTVHCARVAYRTDGTLAIEKSEKFPEIVLTHRPSANEAETKITTESVWYSFVDRIATLKGRSRVTAPIDSDRKGEGGVMDAAWRDEAKFHLVGDRQEELTVKQADFSGAVDVKAPQGKVKSEKLKLFFDPSAAPRDADKGKRRAPAATQPFGNGRQPVLRRVVASEKVFCELADARQGTRNVECDKLELEMARTGDDKPYPHIVDAQGGVYARDAEQDLRARHVVLKLKPAPPKTPPIWWFDEPKADQNGEANSDQKVAAAVLESMLATDAVRVSSRDGSVATGDRLSVTTRGASNDPHIELRGAPAHVASEKNGTVVSKTFIIDPKTGIAKVPGEGSLKTVYVDENAPSKPGRPVEVSWTEGAELNGADNHINLAGKVSVRITETDGTVRTGTAGRMTVQLVDKQPVKPQDSAGKDAAHASKPNDQVAGSMRMDMFKNKDAGLVTLRDSAAVDSALMSVDGKTILQRFHLKSDVIEYDLPARHLSVPVPGQMLVENRADPRDEQARQAKRAKAKEGAKEGAEDDPAASAMNDGATAFQWARRLEFEESAGRAKMEGSVVVNHQPDDKGEAPVRVDADELIAEFVPETAVADGKKDADQSKEQVAAGAQAKGAAPSMPRLRVKSFSAVGNILISREGAELSAGRVDYDPATEWVVARGTGRTPAVFTHPSGNGSATAEELWLNTKTWQVKVIDVSTRAGGPTH